jgi:hypothetical protein
MARATKRCGVSRSFPRRAGEASRCTLQSLAPWKRSVRRYPQGCVEAALTCVRASKMREPRNPINGLLAPQGLVRLFAGYQTRPNRRATCLCPRKRKRTLNLASGRPFLLSLFLTTVLSPRSRSASQISSPSGGDAGWRWRKGGAGVA